MKTNTKEVQKKVQAHILEISESLEMLLANANAVMGMRETPGIYSSIYYTVDGGNFLIYHEDVKKFLDSLDINPKNKEYDSAKSWALYKHLIASNGAKMLEAAKLI